MPELVGSPLHPSVAIQREYAQSILTLVRRMGDETKKALKAVLAENPVVDSAQDADPATQARIAINALLAKYEPLFARVAKKATKRMIARTIKHADVTAKASLKELSEKVTLNSDFLMTPRMQQIISATTTEAVGLIKLIPQKYLGDVQGEVMRSITTGNGLKDLVPALNNRYDGNIRHARNVAMDQTRKAYTGMAAERMKQAGVKEFKWLHISGSQEPRKLHVELSGKTFRYDDPPYIGDMYGQKVHGMPGLLPNCRCVARPVVNFDD